eukprot:938659-Prymnesium_polylepis.1
MRAVNTVIQAAGNNRQANPNMEEDLLVLSALADSNRPKFLAEDMASRRRARWHSPAAWHLSRPLLFPSSCGRDASFVAPAPRPLPPSSVSHRPRQLPPSSLPAVPARCHRPLSFRAALPPA